jgi:hypothetical protein
MFDSRQNREIVTLWRVVSLAEHEQPAFAVVRCQPKDFRATVGVDGLVAGSASRRDEVIGIDF